MGPKIQIRRISCADRVLEYHLTRKPVKNINLRIKADGRILVSANNMVSVKVIDNLVREKQEFIIRVLDKYAEKQKNALIVDEAAAKAALMERWPMEYQRKVFQKICDETYVIFQTYGVPYPVLKIRYMKSRWGSCQPQKGIITLNSKLIEKPRKCIEYVVLHEFAHFIHPNHSKEFYRFVESLMPDWKERKVELER